MAELEIHEDDGARPEGATPYLSTAFAGDIVKLEVRQETDYITLVTANGFKRDILRRDAIERLVALLDMAEKFYGGNDAEEVDRAMYLAIELHRAIIKSAKQRGVTYTSQGAKYIEQRVRKIEKTWRDKKG